MAYIYKLQFDGDERVYIGKTAGILDIRQSKHYWMLKNNKHHSSRRGK
jgi:hypothetical protein